MCETPVPNGAQSNTQLVVELGKEDSEATQGLKSAQLYGAAAYQSVSPVIHVALSGYDTSACIWLTWAKLYNHHNSIDSSDALTLSTQYNHHELALHCTNLTQGWSNLP